MRDGARPFDAGYAFHARDHTVEETHASDALPDIASPADPRARRARQTTGNRDRPPTRRTKLLISSPAPTSRMSVNPTSAATSAVRSRCRPRSSEIRLPSRSQPGVHARRLHRRHQSRREPGQHRGPAVRLSATTRGAPCRARGIGTANISRCEIHRPRGYQETERTADGRENETLDDELTDHTRAAPRRVRFGWRSLSAGSPPAPGEGSRRWRIR